MTEKLNTALGIFLGLWGTIWVHILTNRKAPGKYPRFSSTTPKSKVELEIGNLNKS